MVLSFLIIYFAQGESQSYLVDNLATVNLVNIKDINKNIYVDMRYASEWNFLGRPVNGYKANKCLLTPKAAKALSQVQQYVEQQGYALLVLDCYRPQRAVNDFLDWKEDRANQRMKNIFYPDESKHLLVKKGYLASRSGHSRGSTVDLTLVKRKEVVEPKFKESVTDCRISQNVQLTGQLDMGTTYDCFDSLSNTINSNISPKNQENRLLLKKAMERFGFANYAKEWWHYTLKDETYKDKYFDKIIE